MSETAVPLWKQELLKRRERKFFKDENPTRSAKATNFSSSGITNNSVQPNERKSEISRLDGVPYTNNVTGYTRKNSGEYQGISGKVDGSATRQVSESNEHNLKPHFVSNVKRSNESHSNALNTTGKYEQNRLVHASDITTGSRVENAEVSRLGGESCANPVSSSIHLNENERERLKAMIAGDEWVNDEHIRPRALKKMWKKQESKESLESLTTNRSTQPHKKVSPINNFGGTWLHKKETTTNHLANHIQNTETVTLSNKQSVPKNETTPANHPIEHPGTSHRQVPKAYKSPYAKQSWNRPVGILHGKLTPKGESLSNGFSYATRDSKHETVLNETGLGKLQPGNVEIVEEPQKNRSVSVQEVSDVKVANEHIASVKSLLGLFGGKSTVGKTGVQTKKTNKSETSTREHNITPASNSPKPGNLIRHHSEPSLYRSPSFEISDSLQNKHAVMPTSKMESKVEKVNEVGLSSHQVCSGIQERVTLLRRRSLSSSTMDGIETSTETISQHSYQGPTAVKPKEKIKESELILKEDINLINQKLSNKLKKTDVIDDGKVEKSVINTTSVKSEKHEKLLNSCDNKLTDKINHLVEPQLNQNTGVVPDGQPEIPEQPFDKLLSVFGPKASGKKSIVNDDKATKSSGKIVSKQDKYAVEFDQSECKEVDQIVSTNYSNGISQNQQENKIDIKNGSVETEAKIDEKPRKSRLNIVDPTELIQLTKDPVLVKGKLTSTDVNASKEPETNQKPVDKIIKCEPDKKDKVAQVNRAWDLANAETLDRAKQEAMAVKISNIPNTSQVKFQQRKAIPVTSIDTIPVSSIDSVEENNSKLTEKSDVNTTVTKVNNTVIHNGTTSQYTDNTNITEEEDEFIPVSSIDDDSPLPPPPEIIHDKHPDKVKPCLSKNKTEKNANVSFFQHVFIHDYQSESAATSDWDFENGEAFSSYTPTAIRQFSEMSLPDPAPAPPVSSIDVPDGNQEPTITYNEEDAVGFSDSYDTTAGAMLF